MSIHQFPSQFEHAVITPLAPSEQRIMELSLRLSLSLCLPPKIRNARTANFFDIDLRRQRIDMVLGAVDEFLTAAVEELNENLPVDQILDINYLKQPLVDMRSEIDGALEKRMGE